jgi:hypothetical protein
MNDWKVCVKFKNMPEDADESTMRTFVEAIVNAVMDADVEYEITSIERVRN